MVKLAEIRCQQQAFCIFVHIHKWTLFAVVQAMDGKAIKQSTMQTVFESEYMLLCMYLWMTCISKQWWWFICFYPSFLFHIPEQWNEKYRKSTSKWMIGIYILLQKLLFIFKIEYRRKMECGFFKACAAYE